MFRVIDPQLKITCALYPRVERELPTAKSKGWTKVGGFLLRDKVDYIPQPGLQENFCACESNTIYLCGAATMGKMQPYDAKVLTPRGFVDMGSLAVGDTITSRDGNAQNVLQLFEHGLKGVYRITFDDGASTECGLEHLWSVAFKKPHYKYSDYETHTLEDIIFHISNGEKAAIPFCLPINFQSNKLPIKPYTLGVLLGDGCCRGCNITVASDDSEVIERIENDGYKCTKVKDPKSCDYRLRREGLWEELTILGLKGTYSWEKFIPHVYLHADVESRLELMQGLIDTDGHVDKLGHIQFYTVSPQLAKDVQWLIRSLGGRCSIIVKKASFVYDGIKKQGRDCYVLNINTPINHQIVCLNRKRERLLKGYRNGRTQMRRVIKSIEYVGKKQCRCILVSNPDHLYVTDDFIVTHNTFSMIFKVLYGIDKKGFSSAMISKRLQDSKKGGSIFRDNEIVLGAFAGCNYNTAEIPVFYWSQWLSQHRLAHTNFNTDNPAERAQFIELAKKNQNGLQQFDEADSMSEFEYDYWQSRNRDDSGMVPQSTYSFNPPGPDHYLTRNLINGGYIGEDWYFKPEMNGATRYYYKAGTSVDEYIWGDTPEEVVRAANIQISQKDREAGLTEADMVKSFTAFTGEASDNRMLVASTGGQSVANLMQTGAEQRAVLKGGYFGPIDNEEINVNRQMIHQLWDNPIDKDENIYATMDISKGGVDSDGCPCIIWKGLRIIAIEFFRKNHDSEETHQLENFINGILNRYNIPIANFAYDANGIGGLIEDFLKKGARGISGQGRVEQEYDENGNQVTVARYFNLRSQLLGKTETMLKKGEISVGVSKELVIPYGKKGQRRRFIDVLFDEINVFIATDKNGKIYYRKKEEYKDKFKSSPDLLDAISYRAIFELDTRERKQPSKRVPDNAYFNLVNRPRIVNPWRGYR